MTTILTNNESDNGKRRLFDYSNGIEKEPVEISAKQINAYLVDAAWTLLENRRSPIVKCTEIVFGSMPNDGGNLLLSKVDKDELVLACPSASKWINRLLKNPPSLLHVVAQVEG